MIEGNTEGILAIVVTIVTALAGIFVKQREQFKQGLNLASQKISQFKVLVDTIEESLDDDKLTEGEAKIILKQLRALVKAS